MIVVAREAARQRGEWPKSVEGRSEPRVDIEYRLLAELQEREQELAEAQRVAGIGSWTGSRANDEGRWSDQMYRIFGLQPGESAPPYDYFLSLVHPDDRAAVGAAVERAIRTHEQFVLRHRINHLSGEQRWVESRGTVEVDGAGNVLRVHGTTQDISDRVALEQSLRSQRDFLEAILDALDQPVIALNDHQLVVFSNHAAEQYLRGAGRDDIRQNSTLEQLAPYTFHDGEGRLLTIDELPVVRALSGEVVRDFHMEVELPDIGRRHFVVNAAPVRDSAGIVVGSASASRDVTEHRWADLLLAHDRLHDPLTGLANRKLFVEATDQALERASRNGWTTAVLALDLDHFRDVNERFGHEVGDRVLESIAKALDGTFRASDTQGRSSSAIARPAGDEFFILCENIGQTENVAVLIRRAAEAVATAAVPHVSGHRLTASIGISIGPPGATDSSVLIFDAEAAMREAKSDGGNRQQIFSVPMRQAVQHRIDLEQDLGQALDRDQLRLVYQPKYSLAADRIVGAEALLRWHHPERGMVSPLEFIPVAEASGLMSPIGEWVLREAVRQAARWRDLSGSLPIQIGVNVSTRQFDEGLVELVRSILHEERVDPSLLSLEVTESVAIRDIDGAITILRALRELGVGLSIDDFGTGYSSLTYLRRLPLDSLKIDKSFVDGIPNDPDSVAIVAATVGMAHALGLDVVAEGVESDEQLGRLRALGCEYAQGYHLGRPMPAAELSARLDDDAAAVTSRSASDGSVLVVDDTAEIRQFVRVSLETAGFTVTTAASGEEGLDLARRLQPSCVLVDMYMDGMNGVEVCSELRSHPLTRDCTVILLTADAEKATKLAAFDAGVDDYIIKPFSPRDLVSRVSSAIRRRA